MVILLLIKVLRGGGGVERLKDRLKDGEDKWRDGLADMRKVHESKRNARGGEWISKGTQMDT